MNEELRKYVASKKNIYLCDIEQALPYLKMSKEEREAIWDDSKYKSQSWIDF